MILDCDLMKFPYSGLYQYCLNLGIHVNELLAAENQPPMKMYLPPKDRLILPAEPYHLIEQRWHFWFQPFLKNCRVWHAPFQSGRILPIKQKFPDLKVVLTVHDLNVLHEGKPDYEQLKSMAHTQSLIDRSDAIVCISEFTKNDVLTYCSVGDKPVHVIHNGANKLANVSEEVPADRPPGEFVLGIGYLNRKKNFHVLLPLLQSNPDLELVVMGRYDDPEYVKMMRTAAQDLGIAKRLHLPGPVSEGEKAWYLKNCKALMHPSLAEGFGLPVIEAMQFGKPVFLSTRTSLPEIGGEAAFYFPSFEAEVVQEVYHQGMKTYETTNRAADLIAQATRFNWAESARQYLDVYRSVDPSWAG
jgi:glycosyltransferase involved in cell wall biosynthesis